MAFKVFTLLINGLVPIIPAWFFMNSHPETAIIKPWPIVWTLLGVNVLFILLYCSMQVVWIVSIEIAPDWVGRIRQRKAEERALSGKQHFESREEVLKKHPNKA